MLSMVLTGILAAFLALSDSYLYPILWQSTSDPTVHLPQGKVFGRRVVTEKTETQLERFLGNS